MLSGRLVSVLILAVAAAATPFASGPGLADVDGFTFRGEPIHPKLVLEFEAWLSDDTPPITTAVDIAAAFDTNEYGEDVETTAGGFVRFMDGDGWYAYKPLGQMEDGTHVLHTEANGGGSGIFTNLVFVRLDEDKAMTPTGSSYTRVLMSVVGRFVLGDRDDARIQVLADRVVVGASRYRTSPTTLDFGR